MVLTLVRDASDLPLVFPKYVPVVFTVDLGVPFCKPQLLQSVLHHLRYCFLKPIHQFALEVLLVPSLEPLWLLLYDWFEFPGIEEVLMGIL
jgi:hypothetical protein